MPPIVLRVIAGAGWRRTSEKSHEMSQFLLKRKLVGTIEQIEKFVNSPIALLFARKTP